MKFKKGHKVSKKIREKIAKANTIHGMDGTKIYRVWIRMKERCFNKKGNDYKYWGGRGITVCPEWLGKNGFQNFYQDMGDKPEGKSLDRIDNNGNYCPDNCRWATQKQQQNNRRNNRLITYQGKTQTVSQWAEELGSNCNRIYQRLNSGWSVEKTLETPVGN